MASALKMAAVAHIITVIKIDYSDRRISTALLLDRETTAKDRGQPQAGDSPMLSEGSVHPENRAGVTIENPPNAPTGLQHGSSALLL